MAKYWPGIERMGWTPVYIADEHGCLQHTEPVCTIPTGCKTGHAWFLEWLKKQECPYPVGWCGVKP